MNTTTSSSFKVGFLQLLAVLLVFAFSATAQAGTKLYFVHNDHIGARAVTDSAQNIVWQAQRTPYGKTVVTVNDISFNPRFPGQYYDAESELHYNYFR